MNKLEERFEEILDNNIEFSVKPTGEDEWDYTDVFKKQAKEAKDIAIEYSLWLGALSRFWFYVYDVHTNKWRGISKTPAQGGEMEFTPEGLFDQFLKETYGDN